MSWRTTILLIFILLVSGDQLHAQTELLNVSAFTAKQFPSLTPLAVVHIPLTDTFFADPATWPPVLRNHEDEPSTYAVMDTTTKKKLVVERVEHPFKGDSQEPDKTVVDLILRNDFSAGDKLEVDR